MLIWGGLWSLCRVFGEVGEDFAVFEAGDLVDDAGGFDLFVAAVVINSAGQHGGVAAFADFIFEAAPRAPVELRVLRDGIAR